MQRSLASSIASRYDSRWLRVYIRYKLSVDPVFPAAFATLGRSREPILDIGCGVGLLAFYLRYRGADNPLLGIDCAEWKVREAQQTAGRVYGNVSYRVGDARDKIENFRGNVAMLDMLHYMSDADQRKLLDNVAEYVQPGGIVFIRDTPRDDSLRYKLTYYEDIFARTVGWIRAGNLNFATSETICEPFRRRGFSIEITPLWGRMPYNNWLFVFRRPG